MIFLNVYTGYHERDNIKIEDVLVSFASQLWISPHLQFEASQIGWTSTNYQRLQKTSISDKKISELERLRNKINNSDSHSSASSTTSSSSTGTSAASKVNTSRYKTELCRPFSEHGTCKYGEK